MTQTIVRCDTTDCVHRTQDGYCGQAVIDLAFMATDSINEYSICKDYEQRKDGLHERKESSTA